MNFPTTDIARLFAVRRETVQKWIALGMPVSRMGAAGDHAGHRLDLKKCVAWYFARNFERLELDRARTRLANEQADKTRMENDLRKGDLAEISVIGQVVEDLAENAKTNLLALAGKIAPELEGMNGRQREVAIELAVRECLEQLAAFRPRPRRKSAKRKAR